MENFHDFELPPGCDEIFFALLQEIFSNPVDGAAVMLLVILGSCDAWKLLVIPGVHPRINLLHVDVGELPRVLVEVQVKLELVINLVVNFHQPQIGAVKTQPDVDEEGGHIMKQNVEELKHELRSR